MINIEPITFDFDDIELFDFSDVEPITFDDIEPITFVLEDI